MKHENHSQINELMKERFDLVDQLSTLDEIMGELECETSRNLTADIYGKYKNISICSSDDLPLIQLFLESLIRTKTQRVGYIDNKLKPL